MRADQILSPADLSEFMQEWDIPGELIHLDVPTPTVEAAAQAVGTEPENIVKSILFTINDRSILAITSGPAHVDRRKIAAHFDVGRKKVKLANAETVLKETGYQVGAMPPFGHLAPLYTLIDTGVLAKDHVYTGGGSDQTLLRISPQTILSVTQAQVMDLLTPPTQESSSG